MSYCGEVNEDDWCSFHACMKNFCEWQHKETFEQREQRIAEEKIRQRSAELEMRQAYEREDQAEWNRELRT